MKPGLYIVGTPIGNLGDVTMRALATLQNADIILAEDTRHTRILLDRCQSPATAGRPKPQLVSCHRFNEQARVEFVLEKIRSGKSIALVTKAGMPAVADPGARIVRACRQNKFPVTVIPGPSSVTAALALSGFGGGGFICEGFLPRKAGERTRRLNQLDKAGLPVIIFESPYRCLRLLEELNKMFPEREIFIGRELTKLNEECLWGTAAELIAVFAGRGVKNPGQRIKGEITVVISPAAKKEKKDQEAMGHPGSV